MDSGANLKNKLRSKRLLAGSLVSVGVSIVFIGFLLFVFPKNKDIELKSETPEVAYVAPSDVPEEKCDKYSEAFMAKVLPPQTPDYASVKGEALKASTCTTMGGYKNMSTQDLNKQYQTSILLTKAALKAKERDSAKKFAQSGNLVLGVMPSDEKLKIPRDDQDLIDLVLAEQ